MDISKKLKKIKISDIQPYKNNTKIHTQDQIDQIKKSIEKHGYIQNICVDKNNIIVIGHGRHEALKQMGVDEIEVVDLSNVPVKDINKLRILDNKINESEWDNDLLEKEFKNIYGDMESNIDNIVNDFDFDKDFITDMALKDKYKDKEDEEDLVPEPEKPLIKKGDLIELGQHRLLCGDSTLKEDVDKLMGGKKADMVFTDPPYGISVVGNNTIGGGGPVGGKKNYRKTIRGNNLVKANKYKPVIGDETTDVAKKFYLLIKRMKFSNCIIWGGNYFSDFLPVSRGWIGWDKIDGLTGTTKNFSDIELAWTSYDKPARIYRHRWQGLMKGSEHKDKRIHPTQKPIALSEECLNYYESGNIVLDGFLGSGSTLIACEKTGRACYGMELDEWYCTVIIQRYVNYTGNNNIKINGKEVDWNKLKEE
jgi:DNA modification methylase